jgi:DNA replication initiation complex subunit (GINS family)
MAPEDEPFNFDTIAQVYREERKSKTLTKLPLKFYQRLVNYLDELKRIYVEERSKDPMSSKSMMLEDEYTKAKKRTSQIYEHRERKTVLLALSAANGGNPDAKLMTAEERNAFNTLVETLSKNREYLMLKKENDTCSTSSFLASGQNKSEIEKKNSEDKNGIENFEPELKEKEEEIETEMITQENPVLLILEDIPSFETENGSLNLKKDDAISLSKDVANILCQHGKARVIKGIENGP